jgi:predicted esterase
MTTFRIATFVALLVSCGTPSYTARAQDDVADVPSQSLQVGQNDKQQYFLIGPQPNSEAPPNGFGLILVLPGGDGSADFHPFIKRIYKHALPEDYLIAQLVAPKWNPKQVIVWPTKKGKVSGARFTTEQFVDAVIGDVEGRYKLNASRILTLSWSSGGPAGYAASLSSTKVRGSFVAMSVFKPSELSLETAKGRAYYIYHSPDDRTCPFRMAEQAAKRLEENKAKVKLTTYAGGQGWHGDVFNDIRAGIEWLQQNTSD